MERDAETSAIVSSMLRDLETNGMDAVRKYSRKFDDWDPPSFRLTEDEIAHFRDTFAVSTRYCMPRRFSLRCRWSFRLRRTKRTSFAEP